MTTAALGKLQVTLDLDSGAFNGQVTRSGKVIRQFETDLNRMPAATGGAERAVNSLGASYSRLAKQALGLYAALTTARLVVAGFGRGVVDASASLERMTALLAGMSDAADDAGKLADAQAQLEQITELARTTPFSIDAITDAWVKFKAGGLDPANGSLQSLLDAVASFGGSSMQLERASVAIQQMAGKGVISMEELRQQLGEAVPTAMQDLATATGMSMAKLSKAIASGSVQSKEALARLFAQFEQTYGGSSQRLMDTFGGRVAVMRTSWTELLREVGQSSGLFDVAKRALDQLNQSFQAPAVRQFAVSLAQGMGTLIQSVAGAARAFIEYQRAIIIAGAALSSFLVTTRIIIPAVRTMTVTLATLAGVSGFGGLARSLTTFTGLATIATAAVGRLRIALGTLVTAGGVFTIAASALAALGTAWYLHKKRIDDATQALREHGIAYDDFVSREQEKRLAELKAQMARLQEGLKDPNLGGQDFADNPRLLSATRQSMLVEIERTGKAIATLENDLAKNRAAQAKRNSDAQTEQDLAAIEKRNAELQALLSKPFELTTPDAGNAFVQEWENYFSQLKEQTAQLKRDMRSGMIDDRESLWFSDLTSQLLSDAQTLKLNLIANSRERAEAEIKLERQKVETILRLNNASAEQIAAVQNLLSEKVRAMQENIAANQPLNRLAADWLNLSERMQDATAGWLDDFSSRLVDNLEAGKFAFKDFAKSVIKDLAKIELQKSLAGFAGSLSGLFGANTSAGSFGGTGAGGGTAPTTGGALYAALGGVIDKNGLRKYANGGIATRPQVAVFGEGDQPEAFVPLPDGRTIPVTLKGQQAKGNADAPKLTVNIINQSGQQVSSEQSQARFDGTGYVLDVVLKGMSRPGAFRDGMKSALR